MKRLFRVLMVAAALFVTAALLLTIRTPSRRAAWLAEYDSTRQYLAAADANFDWVVRKKGIDLAALDRRTRTAVEGSWTSIGAAWAVRGFVWEFSDGHTWARIRPNIWWRGIAGNEHEETATDQGTADADDVPSLLSSMSASEACAVAGLDIDARPDGWGLPFPDAPGAEQLADDEFPAVLLALADGTKVGILRIATFGHEHYGPSCARAWEEYRTQLATPCTGDCRWGLVAATMRNGAAHAAAVANELTRHGAVAVVVDVTGNGGGSEFADALARALTPVPLRIAPGGIIRHPHHLRALAERRDAILADSARATPAQWKVMARLIAQIDSLRLEVARDCGREEVWSGATPACSNLLVVPPVVDYAVPGTFDGLQNGWALWMPSWHAGSEGLYRGPLLILQDGRSASASEEFAARLRDNAAAQVIGERSFGAGCGYTDGGTRLELEALGLLIRAPDCQRLRMDGSNETEGISPDIEAGWSERDGPQGRVVKALAAVTRTLQAH